MASKDGSKAAYDAPVIVKRALAARERARDGVRDGFESDDNGPRSRSRIQLVNPLRAMAGEHYRSAEDTDHYSNSSQDESTLDVRRGRKSKVQHKPNAPVVKHTISDDRTQQEQVQRRIFSTAFRTETDAVASDPKHFTDTMELGDTRRFHASLDDDDLGRHIHRVTNDPYSASDLLPDRSAMFARSYEELIGAAPSPPPARPLPRPTQRNGVPQRQQEFQQVQNAARVSAALEILSNELGLEEHASLTLDNLAPLARHLKDSANKNFRCVIIHRVNALTKVRMYLDRPQWVAGAASSKGALIGELPIYDITQYLSKYPDICCIAYRDYHSIQAHGNNSQDGYADDMNSHYNIVSDAQDFINPQAVNTIDIPTHFGETLEPTTRSLAKAIEQFFKFYDFGPENSSGPTTCLLSSPYTAIYHSRKTLDKFLKTLPSESRRQFHAMLDHILSQYQDEYELVDSIVSEGKIQYGYIEYLYKPGEVVVHQNKQHVQGYMSKGWLKKGKGTPEHKTYLLYCWAWEFDGKFARKATDLKLSHPRLHTEEVLIANLNILPLKYASQDLESRLKQRGQWIWNCRIRSLVTYQESSDTTRHDSSKEVRHGERYMIDMMMYRELHQNSNKVQNASNNTNKSFTDIDELQPEVLKQDNPPDSNFVYLTPATIKGYNLKSKRWLELQVDQIREISWDKEAFNSLVIKEKTKRLIRAFISNHIEAERSTDLISGKGNGLILLLHGGPGTGKTLTAESVAEIAERPLYPVTCGDIGTEPEAVENYLESVLHIGKTWGCVVLLDEADVFLEQRSLEDLRRNAVVSVFLRVLEYYEGILILTSNRVGTFDEAFKSRIQLAIHYQNLDLPKRTKIWGNFINRLENLEEQGVDFADLRDNIDKLAMNKMNGR